MPRLVHGGVSGNANATSNVAGGGVGRAGGAPGQRARRGTLSSRAGKRRQVATRRKQRALRKRCDSHCTKVPTTTAAGCSATTHGKRDEQAKQARDGVR